MCALSLLCQKGIGILFLHQVFYYLSTPFPSCPRKKRSEKSTENFPLHWSAWKYFGLWSSCRIFQNYSTQLMDLKPADHWLLCIKAHVQVSLSMYLSVLQDQGQSYQHFVVQRITKTQSNKGTWKSKFGASPQDSERNLILIKWSNNTSRHRRLICGYEEVQGAFPENRKGFFWKLMAKKIVLEFCTSFCSITEHSTKVSAVLDE